MAIQSDWNITDGSFKGVLLHVAKRNAKKKFGMVSQEISEERRLQVSERALVDGADVEDFGRKAATFSADIVFFGDNYDEDIKAVRKVLNEGTSGILILPDLDEAVWAKYKESKRKTSAEDGGSTVLSVTWIEDRTSTPLPDLASIRASQAATGELAALSAQEKIPSILDKASEVLKKIQIAANSISSNSYLNGLSAAEAAITNARVTANAILNVPKNLREQVLNTKLRIGNELSTLGAAVNGLMNFTGELDLASAGDPTRYNIGLGSIDYLAPDTATTTTVAGSQEVVVSQTKVTPIASLPDAESVLKASIGALTDQKADLEEQTSGAVPEFSTSSVQLINAIKDLLGLIGAAPSRQVLVTSNSSLLEVCFRNGVDVSEVDRIRQLNTGLPDLLDIPPYTVINL